MHRTRFQKHYLKDMTTTKESIQNNGITLSHYEENQRKNIAVV